MDDLDEVGYTFVLHHTAFVFCTLIGKCTLDVEQINRYSVSLVGKHSGYGKGIAAIVARTSKDHHRSESGPCIGDSLGDCRGGALHQVDGANGLMINGIFVELANLSAIKYLHTNAKLQKYCKLMDNFPSF